jgi:hypothetical protein
VDQMSKIFSFFLLFWLDSGISFFFLSRAIFHRVLITWLHQNTRSRTHTIKNERRVWEWEYILA